MNIGRTYYDMGKHEQAIPHLEKTVRLDPDHADAHLLLGMTYRALNLGDQARVYFVKTLELEPNHPQAAEIRQWLGGAGE